MKLQHIIAAAAATFCLAAQAEFYSGNDLLEKLRSTSNADRALALGYIAGTADALQNVVICLPPAVTLGQLEDVVKTWLTNNPANRHHTADATVSTALGMFWPCQRNSRGGA